MAQFRVGRVRTQNGSATVRAVYESFLVNRAGGDFQAGEQVTWGADGVGVVTSFEVIDDELRFVRTSGVQPSTGDTITGGTSGATGDVDSFGAGSPPGFDAEASGGDFFRAKGLGADFQIGGNIGPDAFDLAAPFTEDRSESEYAVQRDTTTERGYPLVEQGDLNPSTTLRRFEQQVDGDVERALAPPVESVAADRVLDAVDDRNLVLVVDASGAARTVTLPDAATAGEGWRVTVIAEDVSGGNVTLAPAGTDTLHGGGTLSSQHARLTVIRDDAGDWRRID